MNILRRGLLSLAAAAILAVPYARAEETVTLKLSHWIPAVHPMAVYLEDWARDLEEKTDHRLKIDVFPAGQLGSVTEHYDMVRRGIADIGFILHGMTSDRFPLTSLIELPFMVDSAAHGTRVLNDPELRKILDPEHRGLHVLYLVTHQPGQILTVDREVRKPADLEGLRIRFPSATTKAYLEALGATTVGLPPSAIGENIQKHVIDGVTIDYGGAGIAYRLGGSISYVTELDAYVSSFGLVMNPDAYERLPDDIRAVLDESVGGDMVSAGAVWDGLNAPGKAALVEGGAEIVEPSDAERAAFTKVGAAVTETILVEREKRAGNAREVYDMMKTIAERAR